MSETDRPTDVLEYAKRYLLRTMRDSGLTQNEIEAMVANLAKSNPLRSHFIDQFIESVPEAERESVAQRLRPEDYYHNPRITVSTVAGRPTFELVGVFTFRQVSKEVEERYGLQEEGIPHNWYDYYTMMRDMNEYGV